jgi:cytochrome c556
MWRIILISIAAFAATPVAMAENAGKSADESNGSKEHLAAPPTKWESRVTDTFFPDAREVLVGPRPPWMTAVATGAAKAGKNAPQIAGGSPSGNSAGGLTDAGAASWSKLISADALQDEIKTLGPLLADDVKTQQGFLGGAYKKSRRTLSLLAAAFAIINDYDGDVRWKSQAAVARDLFARSGLNCKASTEQTYRDVKQRSDDLAALLRGETVEGPKADSTNDWSKVANLLPLMSRLELAQHDRIAPWTSSGGDFKKNAAALEHESEMVAALAEVISRPGMENADDEKFRDYAKSLQKSAIELRQAVNNDNYDSARTAAGTLSKACANCHSDFR